MTSQISIAKLLRLETRQNLWLFGLTGLLHFLAGPVMFLISTADYATLKTSTAQYRFENFFTEPHFLMQVFVMIVCISISTFIYRYLFNRRMVDLYHSVPISRTKLFIVKYLHGFLIWLVPFVICNICNTILCILRLLKQPYLWSVLKTQFQSCILLFLCYFVLYHLFLVAVYLSGNVLNMFTNTAIIGCSLGGLWYICYGYAIRFFDTFCDVVSETTLDIICSISPFLAPFRMYTIWAGGDLPLWEHVWFLVMNILMALALLFLAWKLCLKRPSETAECGTCLQAYILPARLIATILCGLAGGYFFSEVVTTDFKLFWGIFGAILASVVSFGAINSIFGANIKSFFRHRVQILLSTAVSTLVLLSFHLDWYGYDTYLPDKKDIAGMAFYQHSLSDDSTYITLSEEGALVYFGNNHRVAQENLFTDTDVCYDLLNTFINNSGGDGSYYYVKVALTNGHTYLRRYFLPDHYTDKLAPLVETEDFKYTNYKFRSGLLGYPNQMELQLFDNTIKSDVPEDAMKQILDAYYLDFAEHYNLEELSSYRSIGFISGDYSYGDDNSQRFFDIPILSTYSRTLAVLEELYPVYLPAVTDSKDIRRINLYMSISNNLGMESVYAYFGYATDIPDEADNAADTGVEAATSVEISPYASTESATVEYELEDAQIIARLYPYLFFGDYRDIFAKKEYVYLGQVVTEKNFTMSAYVKSAELPEEIIDLLYSDSFENQ